MDFFDFLLFAFVSFAVGMATAQFCYSYMMIVTSTKYKDTPYSFTGINDDTYSLFENTLKKSLTKN